MFDDVKILQEKRNVPESAFKLHYREIYDRVMEAVKDLHIERWNEAKYIYTNKIKQRPTCKICGKSVDFKSTTRGYRNTCSRECELKLKSETHKNMWQNYTPEQRSARIKQVEDTREAKTGYRTPFANPEVRKKFNHAK